MALQNQGHNIIVVSMIPGFVRLEGVPFRVLPPGIHWATLHEVRLRFGTTERRRRLFDGIHGVASSLKSAGCSLMYLDGSYITEKNDPRDFDGCWDTANVDPLKLDPVLLDFSNLRDAQKRKYGGEMFALSYSTSGSSFIDFFQTEKITGAKKGIIGVDLSREKEL